MTEKNRKIILFDIDHTMFDAALYRKLMFQLIADFISFHDKEKMDAALEYVYAAHRQRIGYFDTEILLQDLAKELDIDINSRQLFEKILMDEASYEYSIFEETIEVLEAIAKHKDMHIGIFSSGREEHQLRKIETFKHFFEKEHIHILKMKEKGMPEIMNSYKNDTVYLVDDILQILYNAKTLHGNITTIWMKRGPIADQQARIDGFTPDFTVTNLREIVPILETSLRGTKQSRQLAE